MKRTDFSGKFHVTLPVMQAPMLGVVSVEMVAAAAEAGALGCYPLGYGCATEEEFEEIVGNIKMFTSKPFGVNLFVYDPQGNEGVTQLITSQKPALYSADRMPTVRKLLQPYRDRYGLDETDGEREDATNETPRKVNWDDHVAWITKHKLTFVSFTYGIPPAWVIEKLHAEGVRTMGTACSVEEAVAVQAAGMSAVILAGVEAGGPSPQFLPENPSHLGVMGLVTACERYIKIPTVAAGGIATPKAVRAALALGASGVALGSIFLLAYESIWKSKPFLLDLLGSEDQQVAPRPTIITRAYSGKPTRMLVTPIATGMVPHNEAIPYWPLHHSLMADFRLLYKDDPNHPYYPHAVGACYMLAEKRSTRDIIFSIVEGME